MRAGRLRTKLMLRRNVTVPDEGGGEEQGGRDVKQYWCDLRGLSGKEAVQAMQLDARVTHQIIMRYDAEIEALNTEEHRFEKDGRVFNILGPAVDPTGRKRELHLQVEETKG